MNKRLKKLRKELHMTQKDFGKKIGLTNAAISDIEKGKTGLTERNQNLICEKLNVNKEWLLYGNGEMFLPELPENELTHILTEIQFCNDKFIKDFICAYWNLSEDAKKILQKYIHHLLEI
ncbi:MAG: helix-turn-helix transcriptional regulator [Anaerotignum sp.]|nr:transcriptional regulator [Firmicutes bacterium CAG:466]